MRSEFYLTFTKLFCVASWLNAALGLVAYCIGADGAVVIAALALTLACGALAIIFYVIFMRAANREDLDIIKALDDEIRDRINNAKKD